MGLLDLFKGGKAKKITDNQTVDPKATATERGEPYVAILSFELDPENPGSGAFELDWNEHFIKQLWRSGYRDENENDMVDRWFQDICRNVVLESYEKEMADPDKKNFIQRVSRNDGKTEYR